MPRFNITIDSIFGGVSPTYYFGDTDTYNTALAVDPENQVSSTNNRISGILYPIAHSKFSGTSITDNPNYILTNPKTTNSYVYTVDGKLTSFDFNLAMRATDEESTSLPITVTGGNGGGAVYYNNFIYLSAGTNIARYGPIDNTKLYLGHASEVAMEINQNFWTNQTNTIDSPTSLAMGNITYPSLSNTPMPNHPMHVHEDKLYIGDVQGGKGAIHSLITYTTLAYDNRTGAFTDGLVVTGATSGATATIKYDHWAIDRGAMGLSDIQGTFQDNEQITDTSTGDALVNLDSKLVEGHTGKSSASFNALDLPYGHYPTSIESFGPDLAIATMESTSIIGNPGKSNLYIWDTEAGSWHTSVVLPDPYCTALLSHNGILYGWSGNGKNGYRFWRYIGGSTVETLAYIDDGIPPYDGAVASDGERVVWAHNTQYPSTVGAVMAWGFKDGRLPKGLHCIAKTSDTATTTLVNSIAYAGQADNDSANRLIIGWDKTTSSGLDKPDTSGTFSSVWRSGIQPVGQKFKINKIIIPLAAAVAANMTITPKLFVDTDSTSETLTVINNTNYANSERVITLYPTITGNTDFSLELAWSSTAALPVALPITFEIETFTT